MNKTSKLDIKRKKYIDMLDYLLKTYGLDPKENVTFTLEHEDGDYFYSIDAIRNDNIINNGDDYPIYIDYIFVGQFTVQKYIDEEFEEVFFDYFTKIL